MRKSKTQTSKKESTETDRRTEGVRVGVGKKTERARELEERYKRENITECK